MFRRELDIKFIFLHDLFLYLTIKRIQLQSFIYNKLQILIKTEIFKMQSKSTFNIHFPKSKESDSVIIIMFT